MDNPFRVLGGMAGSSMDGLDLVICEFSSNKNRWDFQIVKSATIPYPVDLFRSLKSAAMATPEEQSRLDYTFGKWVGQTSGSFISEMQLDLAAIHGHTVLHRPQDGISWQLGEGSAIARILDVPTVTNFRDKDVKLGGQGAPLVPYGDFALFDEYDACLNLGGIANISVKGKKLAWDISPCNQVLNHFAQQAGKSYDSEGSIARNGIFNASFFESIASIPYFSQYAPKSLPNQFIHPTLLDKISPADGLHTFIHFLAEQIRKDLMPFPQVRKLLITGGGALNTYLVETIRCKLRKIDCQVPDRTLIDFKEALIFAFLGLKCFHEEVNTLASVTGASEDSCGGVIHLPK